MLFKGYFEGNSTLLIDLADKMQPPPKKKRLKRQQLQGNNLLY